MDIEFEKTDGVAVISIREDQLDQGNVDAFLARIDPILDNNAHIAVDLGRLEFIDSSGLSSFAYIISRLRERGGRVCVFGIGDDIRDAVRLVHLEQLMDIYDTRAEAVASFRKTAEEDG